MELNDLERVDKNHMFKEYDRWPEIAVESFEREFQKLDVKDIDHIVFSGMGGSGSIGDTISSILSKKDIHVSNVKGYLLPKTVDSKTLIIATSVSGNTSETLSVLEVAKKTDAKIVGFSSGGKLETFCKNNDVFYQNIPMIHSPRASYTNFLYSILNILEEILPINQRDITESFTSLKKTGENISSHNLNVNNKSLELANFIKNTACIFYPAGLQAAAIRFKNSLQENTKIFAMVEDVIESCHNGIVSWNEKSKITPIFLQGKDDYFKTIERWRIIEEFFEINGIAYKVVKSLDGSILSKITNLVYLLDYTSIYAAVLSNTDPSPVSSIEFIKKRLSLE
tara:strand:- start:1799 stop:2815 length:1017 start_codon:yes stop_codon:yes gene_type:complete